MINVRGIAFGTLSIGAVLAAESAASENYPETFGAALVTLAIYWLAHGYAEFTHRRAEHTGPLGLRVLGKVLRDEGGILTGAAFPLLALIVCWLIGATLTTAVYVATLTAAGAVVVIEVGLGVRERLAPREFAAQAGVGTVLGLLVIALRALLH